ncbi:MAG TPA: periplasmic heavy metal sensor [Aeromonadales bacterium]|nr:periplasmic heavy metal sensor [Aeromonadales bacterium]
MKMINTFSVISLLFLSLSASANPGHEGRAGKNPLMRALHQLDLSAEQKVSVKALLKAEKPTMKKFMVKLAEAKLEMAKLLDSERFNRAQVEKLATEQAEVFKQMIIRKARVFSQLRTLLNQQQIEKLRKMIDKKQRIQHIMMEDI